ncbi:MAG TPA: tetraacyldisaccharide 4'-kinase [Xanthobacteraceae bacterium]|jgi:tetraacyldisaccharide 4'-kinase|nr:tetraacyldisaccharide 4'-kinase [Xanthobacteraceae bacterium]
MREPAFWWRKPGLAAGLLAPLGTLYGTIASARLSRRGARAAVPVVCIGNPTIGGAGKTPLALTLAGLLQAAGEAPVLLSRGYGGRLAGPLRVEAARHRAADVGDEPLLLARVAPTVVARDRVTGAQAAVAAGASVIVMDDGFQNPSLQKSFSVLVVDARRGIGNGRVVPAGPLRAPLPVQLARADALVTVGASDDDGVAAVARGRGLPVFRAGLAPDAAVAVALAGARVLAFAGIGDPGKFFATLAALDIVVVARVSFPDHHRYTPAQARMLCEQADRESLILVTTEKDLARMQGDPGLGRLAARARALPVTLTLADADAFLCLLRQKLAAAR